MNDGGGEVEVESKGGASKGFEAEEVEVAAAAPLRRGFGFDITASSRASLLISGSKMLPLIVYDTTLGSTKLRIVRRRDQREGERRAFETAKKANVDERKRESIKNDSLSARERKKNIVDREEEFTFFFLFLLFASALRSQTRTRDAKPLSLALALSLPRSLARALALPL